jgi:hypothetical protein
MDKLVDMMISLSTEILFKRCFKVTCLKLDKSGFQRTLTSNMIEVSHPS